MKSSYYLACDLGSKTIKAALGSYDAGRNTVRIIDVAHANSEGIEKGIILNTEAVAAIVRDLIYQMGLSKGDPDHVCFSLSGSGLESRNRSGEIAFSQPTRITYGILDRLDKVISDSAPVFGKSVMFVSNKKYYVDGEFTYDPLREKCTRFQGENFLAYADDRQKAAVCQLVDLVGLKDVDIFPESYLAAEACIKQGERDLGVVLADVGWDKTDVAVFTEGNIQLCAVLPVGIHDLVNTISWVYRIPFEEASYVFDNYSNLLMTDSKDKKLLGLASDPERKWLEMGEYNRFLEDLVRQLADRVTACVENEGYGDQVFAGYVYTGGLAMVRGLAAALSREAPRGLRVKTGRSYGLSGMDYITEDPQWFPVLGALKVMAADDAGESARRETIGKKFIGFFSRLFPK